MATLPEHLKIVGSSKAVHELRYMSNGLDAGSLGDVFDPASLTDWTVGPALGEDDAKSCYDHWLVRDADGEIIGELRDDAAGYTFHDAEQ